LDQSFSTPSLCRRELIPPHAGKIFTPAKSYGSLLNVDILRPQKLPSILAICAAAQVRSLL